MHSAFLATLLVGGIGLGQTTKLENLDFAHRSLRGWDGQGFVVTGLEAMVSSSETETKFTEGTIRHLITIPAGVAQIRFKAYVVLGPECQPNGMLDIVLAGEGNHIVPRLIRTATGWSPSSRVLPRFQGKPREYAWDVSGLAGQLHQIVIADQDNRPGCYVVCGSFQLVRAQEPAEPTVEEPRKSPDSKEITKPVQVKVDWKHVPAKDDDFIRFMSELQKKHKLAPMARYDGKRFTAVGNASETFMNQRVRQCEYFYDLFYYHFAHKGFNLRHPSERLMLAVFDHPDGFEAYMGQKMPVGITGIYHPLSNRLVLYDLNANRGLVAQKNQALKAADRIGSPLIRSKVVQTIEKEIGDISNDLNLTTTVHEAAHQMSFNCGLLNRHGDVPLWLAEGLACYCEATEKGEWQAIGTVNSARVGDLARAKGAFLSLEKLFQETWRDTSQVSLGYAQSWALFRMLLQERPHAMQAYLALIYPRRTPDHHITDFRQSFGPDLALLEYRYQQYLRELVAQHGK